ncbi:MAG: hypothetical protein COA52_11035 [Hyphomicrobiales bacterium]|nr:MAG: hypothetical protein COA52_11035 [Hyphomicrobiales bacterium]
MSINPFCQANLERQKGGSAGQIIEAVCWHLLQSRVAHARTFAKCQRKLIASEPLLRKLQALCGVKYVVK